MGDNILSGCVTAEIGPIIAVISDFLQNHNRGDMNVILQNIICQETYKYAIENVTEKAFMEKTRDEVKVINRQ